MNAYLKNLDKDLLRIVKTVASEADNLGVNAYLVGGIVRDLILKRKNLDLDVVVESDAIAFAKSLNKKIKGEIIVHNQFRTATIKNSKGVFIDFVTARKETYKHSGALPKVRMTQDLKDDLFRRDFTINTLAICINKKHFGQLIDEFGGLKDIIEGKIKILHDKSFIDDPTRILRGIRFEQRFDFRMDRKTLSLLKEAVEKKKYKNVKKQRYFADFKKVLKEQDPLKSIVRMKSLKVLGFLSKDVNLSIVKKVDKSIKDLKRRKSPDLTGIWFVYFMALVEGAQGLRLQKFLNGLGLPREKIQSLVEIEWLCDVEKILNQKKILKSDVYKALICMKRQTVLYLLVRTKFDKVRARITSFLKNYANVDLKIDGNDLKKIGFKTGKNIGIALKKTLYEKLDKNMMTKAQELSFAKALLIRT